MTVIGLVAEPNQENLLPTHLNEHFHYWKMRKRYQNNIAVSLVKDGLMLVRFNQAGDWYHLYAFTCDGRPLPIWWIDGGTQFDPLNAALLIEIGQALIELEAAKRSGRLREALKTLGFTTIYSLPHR